MFRGNLRLRMSALLIVFVFLVFLFAGILFAVYERRNQRLLYDAFYETVIATSHSLDRELSAVESLGIDLLTDGTLRSALRDLNRGPSPYERYLITRDLGPRLRLYTSLSYVHGVVAVDAAGRLVHSGGDVPRLYRMLDPNEIETFSESGEPERWIVPGVESNRLFHMRTLRDADVGSFDTLGVMVIVLNKAALARATVTSPFADSLEMSVFHGNRPVYSYRSEIATRLGRERIGESGYSVKTVGGTRYFVATGYSRNRSLTFVYAIPYRLLFSSIQELRVLFTIVGVVVCAALVAMSMWLAKDVTDPIVRLARHMRKVEQADFRKGVFDLGGTARDDEIGVLHREFALMLDRIEALIGERYRSELALKDAQFRSLQLQVNPHFLYNTLDSINWLAQLNDQEEIATMVQSLGTLLRSSLDSGTPAVTLAQELSLLDNYLQVQKIRYADRLLVGFDIDERCLECGVPKLILQPLVENAIKYALEQIDRPCEIRVSADVTADEIELRVSDNGPGIERGYADAVLAGTVVTTGSGVGIRSIVERLRRLYSHRASLTIESERGSGATVVLRLPCEDAGRLAARMRDIGRHSNAGDHS